MTSDRRPGLEGQPPAPTGPQAAGPAEPRPDVGVPKGVARQGVLSIFRTEPRPAGHARHASEDPTPERPGIRIYAPPVYRHHYDRARWSTRYGDTPTAAYACTCGETDTARGQEAVAALVHDYATHKHFCTGTPAPPTEGRNAA
jgi:hypothetical protein